MGHLEDGRARLVALLAPLATTELVQPRRRRVGTHVAGGTIALHLIDTIQRDVQPVATLVLDDRDLDAALTDERRGETAIDADAMLEMHDVIAALERRDHVQRCAAGVFAGATDAPLATEDLVVGEDAESFAILLRRQQKAGAEHAQRERRATAAPTILEQFLETFQLPAVVAEDQRRRTAADQRPQRGHVAAHGFGRAQREADIDVVRRGIDDADRAEAAEPPACLVGRLEELLAGRRILATTTRDIHMMQRLGPRALQLRLDAGAQRLHDERVRRQQVDQRDTLVCRLAVV